jgi:hypothetical protein
MEINRLREFERLTVQFTQTGSRGVLISGNMVFTSPGCFDVDENTINSLHILNSHGPPIEVNTQNNRTILLELYYYDRWSRLAILGPHEFFPHFHKDEDLFTYQNTYLDFWSQTSSIGLVPTSNHGSTLYTAYLYNIKEWIEIKIQHHPNLPFMCILDEPTISSKAYGGPIINNAGELVGIIPNMEYKGSELESFYVGSPWDLQHTSEFYSVAAQIKKDLHRYQMIWSSGHP